MAKKSKLLSKAPTKSPSWALIFGPPPVLEGEDAAAYDQLLVGVSSAVKPADVVDQIWVRDVVDLTWEIFRWRRLKIGLLELAMTAALARTLIPLMPKRPSLSEDNTVFPNLDLSFAATPSPAYELADQWAAGEPTAVSQVTKLMASANVTMDAVIAKALVEKLDDIERIDRLATVAEGRRNSILREIDRRRANFAHALREKLQDVEEAEFKVIESKTVSSKIEPGKTRYDQRTQTQSESR